MPMQEGHKRPQSVERNISQYKVEKWKPNDVSAISRLEEINWAPWLRKSSDNMSWIASKFPDTQLLVRNESGNVVAALTANRINWDGNVQSLGTWDDVVRGSKRAGDYSSTHVADGNTICLTSSAVDPLTKGEGLAAKLVTEMRQVGRELGVDHLIGPFRPSAYGEYKLEHGPVDFAEYCAMTREDGQPLDPWIRNAKRLGMQPLRVEEASMVVEVPMEKFEEYKATYHPTKWKDFGEGRWECGETGSWYVSPENGKATYVEPNLWGEIPLK